MFSAMVVSSSVLVESTCRMHIVLVPFEALHMYVNVSHSTIQAGN